MEFSENILLVRIKRVVKFLGCCGVLALVSSLPVMAVSVSPEMLAQFQRLPKAQQQKLMKQYGLKPSDFEKAAREEQELDSPELVTPRGEMLKASDLLESEREEEEDPDELKPFGYDLFAGEPTTFAPVSDIPVPSEYKVGPGDVIQIQMYGKENQEHELRVSRNGSLQLPEMGPITVTGMTFDEVKELLTKRIQENYLGVDVSISLGELRSIRVLLAGEAHKPGSYTVSSLSTITQALFVSGGVSDIGSLRDIQLKRNGKLVGSFDLYELLLKGDASQDLRLQSGDVVFIPAVGKTVSVKGEVRRPAIYELKGKETMADLLRLAAGLKANAYPKKALLQRYDVNHLPSLINIDLTDNQQLALAVKDGDLLEVKSTSESVRQQVTLVGAVARPGQYQWREGMRVSDLIDSLWSDIKGKADLQYSLIIREVNIQGDIQVLDFSLSKVLSEMRGEHDVLLEPRDKLIIFNHRDSAVSRKELDELIEETLDPEEEPMLLAAMPVKPVEKEELTKEEMLLQEIEEADNTANFLKTLFDNQKLIELSHQFARHELLLSVIEQLKSQSNHKGSEPVVSISGEIRYPGDYPLSENFRISDLVVAAGGLKDSAYTRHAELTSTIVNQDDGASVQHHAIALHAVEQGNLTEDRLLQSKDHLSILQVPDWQENLTVELKGEVKFPGIYTIRNGETMSSVVARAGGFTADAFVVGSVFTRESVKEQERQQNLELAKQLRREIAARGLTEVESTLDFEDASKMLGELEKLEPVGRMVVDMVGLHAGNAAADVRLEDGDILHVPSVNQVVTVVGEIHHASTHFYRDSLSYEDYIRLAGGLKQRADGERLYILRADGSVQIPQTSFWFGDSTLIQAGDTIVVPLDVGYKDPLTLWSQVTQIFYNSAIAIAAINKL